MRTTRRTYHVMRSGDPERCEQILRDLTRGDPDLRWVVSWGDVDVISLRGERVEAAGDRILSELDLYSLEELLDQVDCAVSDDARRAALRRLAWGSPDLADDAVVLRLRRAVTHPSPQIRIAAASAMGMRMWPIYAELLARVAEGDPDPDVRLHAKLALLPHQDEEPLQWGA